MHEMPGRKAIIYCRVSDKKQKSSGDGLNSQEHRCREYSASRRYQVVAVFQDDVSGGGDFMNRPGMVSMLKFLARQTLDDFVVIFDDLKRFARDTMFHLKLRQTLATHRATVECLNFRFEDTPEGQFVETVIAAQGQLERLQNRRQVIQKMKARMERGYYVLKVVLGYRYEKVVGGTGKMLVRDEPVASVIQEALEGFASRRFETQADLKRWLEVQPHFPKVRRGIVTNQKVKDILTRPLYAGLVGLPEWGISWREGQHAPLVSFETYRAIQDRLNCNVRAPARTNLHEDFPLRGFVACSGCSTPLTACWAQGRTKKYAYYRCPKPGCESGGKSIRRDVIESDFQAVLTKVQPSEDQLRLAQSMFEELLNRRAADGAARLQKLQSELDHVQRRIDQFVGRLADTDSPSLLNAYERRIRNLEEQKLAVNEQMASGSHQLGQTPYALRTALDFLSNPLKLWRSERLEDKRTVLKLVFAGRLSYSRGGFKNPKLSLPFQMLED